MPHRQPADVVGSPAWVRRIRFRHLEMLLAIQRHGSLTATADALGITQPAVSQWLADIEAAIGTPLFVRGQRLRATEAAAPLLRHAQRVLADARRVVDEVAAIGQGQLGLVRVGVMQVAAASLMPATIHALDREGVSIELSVVEDVAAGLWGRLERGELDLLITRLDQRALNSPHRRRRLFADEHRVVCANGHPLTRRRRPSWADAARYPWVMPPRDTPLRAAIEATFVQAGVALPQVRLSSVSMFTNQEVLRSTDWLAVQSSETAALLQHNGVLRPLPLTLTHDIGDVGLVWKADASAPALQRLLDVIERVAARRTAGPDRPRESVPPHGDAGTAAARKPREAAARRSVRG